MSLLEHYRGLYEDQQKSYAPVTNFSEHHCIIPRKPRNFMAGKNRMRFYILVWAVISLGLKFPVGADEIKQVAVAARSIAYDSFSRRIYAVVPPGAPAMQNSLVIIDPINAKIEKNIFMGENPEQIAISDKGKYVWVTLNGSTIRRFDIETQKPGPLFFLGENVYAEEIHAVPGNPEALLVVKAARGRSPRFEGIMILENGMVRPVGGYGNTFAFGTFANRAYSYNNETTGFDFMVATLTSKGLEAVSEGGGLISGFYKRIRSDNGLLYVDGAEVIDPETRTNLGVFPVRSGAYAIDSSVGRMFYAFDEKNGVRILSCDLHTFAQIDSVTLPDIKGGAQQLLRWGEDGLAFITAQGSLVLFRTALVPPKTTPVDISVRRSAVPASLKAGQPMTYTLSISNSGNASATNVVLTDRLPREIDVLDLKSSQGDITAADGIIRAKIGKLAPQKSVTIQVSIQPRKDLSPPFEAIAIVRANERDKNPLNNATIEPVRFNNPAVEPGRVVNEAANPPSVAETPLATPSVGMDLTGKWTEVDQTTTGAGVDIQATLTGTFVVKNSGVKPSPKCKIRFYLVSSFGTNLEEELLEEQSVPPLAPGKTKTLLLKARIAKGRSAIGQSISAVIDATKMVKDVNRDNNVVRSKPLP